MSRRRMPVSLPCRWVLLAAVVLLASCGKEDSELPGAASEPAAAVSQLAGHLHSNDLEAFARSAVPPAQYAQLEAAWSQGHSRWPLIDLPLDDKLPVLLESLSAPDAEKSLQRAFRAQIAGQAAGVRQAAHSLGLFGAQYLGNQGDYSAEERAHYVQLVKALSDWAIAAPLSDSALAQSAIAEMTAAARATGLRSDADFQAAGMTATLQKLGPLQASFKQVLASYGLSWDATLAGLRTGLVEQKGDQATVKMRYTVAGTDVDVQVPLQRVDGRWYLARTLEEVTALLKAAEEAEAERLRIEQQAALEAAPNESESAKLPASGDQIEPAKP
jgi:hypothetical protein